MHAPLDKALRRELERTVIQARQVAEHAAGDALRRLGVEEAKAPDYLNDEQRALRNRLRAHGRQLGDLRRPDGRQELGWLQGEIAYEHWHRMLFARFLEQNHLLMYDAHTPVTLEECNELAADEGCANGWQLAGRLASRMLPQIFREDSPALAVPLAPDTVRELENLIDRLAPATFTASDSLGWVYQFWQAKKKDEVNASEVKIGAKELPAVTQLFTEPYMVSFLLDNSLGAWWAARRLSAADLRSASSEDELRRKAAIPGVPLEYLRFVQVEDESGNKVWTPASGTFDAWPEQLSELKTLDPCCGSGHFLVAAFLMLVPMRMELEALSAKDAVDAVLAQNIHGLELDQRCVEIAAFALAITAWKYPGGEGCRLLPSFQLACSGVSFKEVKEELKQMSGASKNLEIALGWMYEVFDCAPYLGSLLNPSKSNAAKIVSWEYLHDALRTLINQEKSEDRQETAIAAKGAVDAARILSEKYHWVVTNVPYLGQIKQDENIKSYCADFYPFSKSDLATVFLERCIEFCREGGVCGVVMPQNLLFVPGYARLRMKILENNHVNLIASLGYGAFHTPLNVSPILFMATKDLGRSLGFLSRTGKNDAKVIRGISVLNEKDYSKKIHSLVSEDVLSVLQEDQVNNPDSIIRFSRVYSSRTLGDYCDALFGSAAGDKFRFTMNSWEVSLGCYDIWELHQTTPTNTDHYSGRYEIIKWEKELGEMYRLADSVKHLNHKAQQWRSGKPNWGKRGVTVSLMGNTPSTLYTGEIYAAKCTALVPRDQSLGHISAVWEFCRSGAFRSSLRAQNSKLAVEVKEILQVPFDIDHWSKVAEENYPHGLPVPYSNDPTQWIFHGHPCGSVIWDEDGKWTAHGELRVDDTVLQVAVARLLGYRWPAELDADMELAAEQREWVKRCDALLGLVDDDGIVCLPALRREKTAADRLEDMLQAAYGDGWSQQLRSKLLAEVGSRSLETWLRDKFFEQHCKLFQDRPFIWQVWDGQKDGFSALLNYHKLNRATLERLIYTYLGDWINRQEQALAEGVDGAEVLLAAARNLKKQLELILKGEAPYDIFVRWKPIEQQPIGWEPDLNDGVRLNIRPFLTVEDVGKKGAGVLRAKPNIKWGKDRGKDVETAPWYKLGLEYGEGEGARINDHHLTLAEKQAVRDAAKGSGQ